MVRLSELKDRRQTVKGIFNIARKRGNDLKQIFIENYGKRADKCDLLEFYTMVRSIPYKKDVGFEIIGAPLRLVTEYADGMDCKKKTCLICCYMHLKHGHRSYRIVCSSKNKRKIITHVYPEIKFNNRWLSCDATYPYMSLGEKKKETAREVYYP